MASSTSTYRPDIDGLRAIAVIAVIINHFNKELLLGGFLGVDIFFVISGFVITSSLVNKQVESRKDFIAGFYAKRIKRIIPALIICILVSSILGSFFIQPFDLQSSLWTGISSLFGSSNLFLLQQSTDYFYSPLTGKSNLFLHTWSLGVEEQFYFVYPFIYLYFGQKSGLKNSNQNFLIIIMIVSALSFIFNYYLTNISEIASFYLMPSRLWEFGIGIMVFFLQSSKWLDRFAIFTKTTNKLIITLGLFFLIYSLISCEPINILKYTIIITLSTGVIILFKENNNYVSDILSTNSLVLIGKASYSLYLWHWTIIIIFQFILPDSPESRLIQIFFIIGFSIASYNFIEKPFRYKEWNSSKFKTIVYGISALFISSVLLSIIATPIGKHFFLGRIPNNDQNFQLTYDRRDKLGNLVWSDEKCVLSSDEQIGEKISFENCTFGNLSPAKMKILVIGNSFSAAEIDMYLPTIKSNSTSVTVTSCWGASPVGSINFLKNPWKSWNKVCSYYWEEVIPKMISKLSKGDTLLMVNDISEFSPKVSSNIKDDTVLVNNLPSNIYERQASVIDFLRNTSNLLKARNINVVFQSTIPFMRESGCTPSQSFPQWFNYYRIKNSCNFYTRNETITRKSTMDSALKELELELDNFFVLDVFDDVCPEDICKYISDDGNFIYRDGVHLSDWASEKASPKLIEILNRKTFNKY